MHKITHSDDATALAAAAGGSPMVRGRVDAASLRSRKMLVALLALLALLAAGLTTAVASDTTVTSADQLSADGTSEADVALFSRFGATWS